MAKKKRYSKEFRLQAAELVVRQGYTQAEASRRLGVSSNCCVRGF
ncbi:MAG: transposase [Candidatus Nealsonbacteria bacterium]|nr:transposase [Candidatus Nealsonbacteria bacterium]